MTTIPIPKYIRTEPPAPVTTPMGITLDDYALELFNNYRQARHAWLCMADDADPVERGRAGERHSQTAKTFSSYLASMVQVLLGEPSDWAHVES